MKKTAVSILALSLFLSGAPDPFPWKALAKATVTTNGDALIFRSHGGEFGKCVFQMDLNESSPHKYTATFEYLTDGGRPANAGFTFSFNYSSNGANLVNKNAYWRLAPATNGYRKVRFDTEVMKGATRVEVCFQPQGPIQGTFPASFVQIKNMKFGESGPGPEAAAYLAKPLTKSDRPKIWPKGGLRGFNMNDVIAPVNVNSQNPGEYVSDETFQKLVSWKVNLLRLWIHVDRGSIWGGLKRGQTPPPIPESDPMAPYREHLSGLHVALQLAEKYHMQVILTVSDIVGRRIDVMYNEGDGGGFEKELQKIWAYVAREYGKHPNMLGFDLLNEPNGKEEARWKNQTLPSLIKIVRAADTNTFLVVEPSPWALPWGFSNFEPVNDPKVAYSLHHYMPHTYTHQGLYGYSTDEYTNKAYPGTLKKFPSDPPIFWDKAEMEKDLVAAAAFQKKTMAPMFVGEFSVLRWAPGGAKWVEDSIDLFEKYEMDWAFHCYWSWNGWNPTFGPEGEANNDSDGGVMTDRMKVLLKAFQKNKR